MTSFNCADCSGPESAPEPCTYHDHNHHHDHHHHHHHFCLVSLRMRSAIIWRYAFLKIRDRNDDDDDDGDDSCLDDGQHQIAPLFVVINEDLNGCVNGGFDLLLSNVDPDVYAKVVCYKSYVWNWETRASFTWTAITRTSSPRDHL